MRLTDEVDYVVISEWTDVLPVGSGSAGVFELVVRKLIDELSSTDVADALWT